jgi:thioredoxin reductase
MAEMQDLVVIGGGAGGFAAAMLAEATLPELTHFIPQHPSRGEALVGAAMDVETRSIHMPKW